MKKEEFIRQLEYLLQDIQEDDKRDAIDSVSYTHLTLPTILLV